MGKVGNEQRVSRGRLFDKSAQLYADGRPGYPDTVFELLRERCRVGRGSKVLEIGAGTGHATIPMLRAGAHVTVVEPGAELARRLEERAAGPDLEIIVSTFEDAEVPDGYFDLVASATAFHWVDPDVGLTKCAAALRDHGWLALWWNVFGDENRDDPFHDALQPILAAKAPQLISEGALSLSYALDIATRESEIAAAGHFAHASHAIMPWNGMHTPAEIRRMFSTFSSWLALEPSPREVLLDDVERLAREEFGGTVVRPYQTIVYWAQRLPR